MSVKINFIMSILPYVQDTDGIEILFLSDPRGCKL